MACGVAIYLEDAFRSYEEALKELEEGVRENNAYKIRDSAEKAWNAVVQSDECSNPEAGGKASIQPLGA
ncbi:MAG: hypothetical protein QXL64_08990 [Thermofilaceae archaeon]